MVELENHILGLYFKIFSFGFYSENERSTNCEPYSRVQVESLKTTIKTKQSQFAFSLWKCASKLIQFTHE